MKDLKPVEGGVVACRRGHRSIVDTASAYGAKGRGIESQSLLFLLFIVKPVQKKPQNLDPKVHQANNTITIHTFAQLLTHNGVDFSKVTISIFGHTFY